MGGEGERGALASWGGGLLRKAVRSLAGLSTEWEAEDSIYVEGTDRLKLQLKSVNYGCRVKLEFSFDDVNWYQRSIFTTDGSDQIFVPMSFKLNSEMSVSVDIPIWARYCRLSSKHI